MFNNNYYRPLDINGQTTGDVFYRENVQRLPLPLVCKECENPLFLGCIMLINRGLKYHLAGWHLLETKLHYRLLVLVHMAYAHR